MARTAIQPPDMADPRPRYSHGWRVGNTVYVAGQFALDQDGKLVGPNDIGGQTRRGLENMRRILETGGASLRDVVKVTVFVTDIRWHRAPAAFRVRVRQVMSGDTSQGLKVAFESHQCFRCGSRAIGSAVHRCWRVAIMVCARKHGRPHHRLRRLRGLLSRTGAGAGARLPG